MKCLFGCSCQTSASPSTLKVRLPAIIAMVSILLVWYLAVQAWEEFKPYKKENKRTQARDRARASASGGASADGSGMAAQDAA